MATRSRTSFQKRQKEIARLEKQRDKAAKRMQRKLADKTPGGLDDLQLLDEFGNPVDAPAGDGEPASDGAPAKDGEQ